jgi:hypothetical protein
LRTLGRSTLDSRSKQIELTKMLLDLAEEVSASTSSVVATTRALTEWIHENDRNGRPLLDRAVATSHASNQRGHAISNLALWFSAKGMLDDAITFSREAICVSNVLVFPRSNLAIWATAIGDLRQADRFLFEAAALAGIDDFRNRWPWVYLRDSLEACFSLIGTSVRERRRSVNSLWIAYHRAGGLISGSSERRTIPESESGL